ncbi:MAG: Crp/Fnr family transcriptional regulator [Lewinellaceae bacterium]|nr:Crp/Fnr family transcriptional regulator [Saprospiraceae bacterium]MCB9340850.1 Crp/Fnr family transcriptional regulator [Lewinellaceae bacterium]
MYESLLQHVSRRIRLDKAEEDFFISVIKHQKLRKKQFFTQAGEVCKYSGYVLKGCLRTYEVDKDGNEHILQFSIEDWWVGDLYSFFTGTPSRYFVDALEPTELALIDLASQELLYEKVPKFERYFRLLVQNAFVASQRRVVSAISKPAEERYLEFHKRYPTLEQRIPQHQIASYLGITPESLSRIRKQLSNRKP